MSVALDLGSHWIRSLRYRGEALSARRQRSSFAVIPDVPAQRERLRAARIGFATCDGNLVLMGDSAIELSRVFDMPAMELLPGAMVPQQNPVARQIAGILVDALLGQPQESDEVCCFIQPAQVVDARDERGESLEFFRRLIRLKGYWPLPMSAGQALVFAELARDGFTGIATVLGASGAELCVTHRGVPLFSRSIPRGGRWLDEQLARQCELVQHDASGRLRYDVDQAQRVREDSGAVSQIASPLVDQMLSEWIGDLADHLVGEIIRSLEETPRLSELPQPLAVVLGGGMMETPGLVEMVSRLLLSRRLPVRIQTPRLAHRSPYTIARGCLINAELEITTRSFRAAA